MVTSLFLIVYNMSVTFYKTFTKNFREIAIHFQISVDTSKYIDNNTK